MHARQCMLEVFFMQTPRCSFKSSYTRLIRHIEVYYVFVMDVVIAMGTLVLTYEFVQSLPRMGLMTEFPSVDWRACAHDQSKSAHSKSSFANRQVHSSSDSTVYLTRAFS